MGPKKCIEECIALAEKGLINLAIMKCDEALEMDKFFAPALWGRSFLKMLQGNYSEWPCYEWYDDPRYSPQKGWFKRRMSKPLWQGQELKGEKVFLYCDEGYGDLFQFIRYAKLVKDCGGYTIVEAHPNCKAVCETCIGVDEVVESGYSTKINYDLHCPLMLLPKYFENTVYNSTPYIHVPLIINKHLKDYLSIPKSNSCGIVWKGNPSHSGDKKRSIPPEYFSKIKTKMDLVSLQYADYCKDFISLGMMLTDWTDTAHLIASMKLIITVDTAVAHLAGAMGKECWLLLPEFPDWRWGLESKYTPWYSSILIFRNKHGWDEVFEQISRKLS